MAEPGQDLKFRNVKILKTQALGVGSYGSVYRATCDQLPCAAKVIHKVLVNRKERRNLEKFEQECYFLSGMRHPNIVQYLGTYKEPKSNPILLMELMDENLTDFLKRSQEPLPYHLEVNLCHDIALALAYLHSNGIIHRDLSSNNVLLIAGSRAKVTDFGMSKLVDAAPQTTPLTQCPGTAAYMSPEALRIPPVYTKLLDSFSHGVLGIQIMTREFPSPGSNEEVIEDPRSPVGMIKIPIPDTERRKAHIDRIDPNHPLLPIAIRCLSYNEKDRPSAQQLCHQLATLKEDVQYNQSLQRAQERGRREQSTVDMEKMITELQRKVSVQERENRQLTKEMQQLNLQHMGQLQEKDEALQVTKQETEQLYHDNRSLRQDLEQAEQVREETMKQAQEEKECLGEKARQIREELVKQSNNDRTMLRAAQQANEQLHHSFEQAVQEIGRLTAENLQLSQDNQEMTRENLQRSANEQSLEQDKEGLTQDKQRLTQLLTATQQSNHQLTQDKQRLTQQLTATQQSNHQLTQDKQRLTQQLTATQQLQSNLSINNQQLSQQLAAAKQANQQLGRDLDMATRTSQQFARDQQRLMGDLRGKEYVIEGKERQLREHERDIAEFQQTLVKSTRDIQKLTQDNQQLTQDLRDRDEQIEAAERLLRDNEQNIAEFQQTLIDRETEVRSLKDKIATKEAQLMQQHTTSEASNSAKGGTIWLRWAERPKAPSTMYTEQATSHGTTAYFSESGHVYAYDSTKEEWSELPKCPQEGSTIVVVKDLLTAVGGEESGKRTNTLLSLKHKGITKKWGGDGSQKKWSKHFPPMPTKRTATAAVCSGRSLVVAGGSGEKLRSLSTVEVMDTDIPQWSTASSLSHPVQKASMAICGDNLYLLGGYSQSGHPSEFALASSLSDLLMTSRLSWQRSHSVKEGTKSRERRGGSLQDDPRTVWNRVANVPALATCATLFGHLLVIGGRNSDKSYTNDILQYDPAMNAWTVISRMPTPRAQGLVTVLPGDKLMVVGGWNSSGWTDAVETASVI